MRFSPSDGLCCTRRRRFPFDQRRAALRPKNIAGEYGQLRLDFKTSAAPGRYGRTGIDRCAAPRKEDMRAGARCARWTAVPCRPGPTSMARLYPADHCLWSGARRGGFGAAGRPGADDTVTHPLGASRRLPWRLGSARRITGEARSPRRLRRPPWRRPRPRTAPGRPDPTGRRRPLPTAPPRQEARPTTQRRCESARPAVRTRAAGTTAGSTGGDVPFPHR